jgi:hypothetical protein
MVDGWVMKVAVAGILQGNTNTFMEKNKPIR